ncbi:threonine aldolase family protein [Roseobacter sp. HKCCA0434]|uniref:threonine aldolase family protein n=1 Tax=Roseobacter sp. HKCCA0434 TaxID=3079297 RepID=UPI002905DE04|nr:beta-eliminating lyase-related protein [Roseobacter sp. HKCCA0434]
MNFASDNAGPAHPSVWEAMARADRGHATPYGNDDLTRDVANRLRDLIGLPDAAVALVTTGTAANSLALACLCPPWGRIYCAREAHIEVDELGAPEAFIGGGKLTLLDTEDGRFTPDTLRHAIASAQSGIHANVPAVVSLTNLSEAGTLWPLADIAEVVEIAHGAGLKVHLDGARLANAIAAADYDLRDLFATGLDAVVFGGTKNGLPGVEAVILRNGGKQLELEQRRKRFGHLLSKHRYLAAQMDAYLTDGLWRDLATRANAAAAKLSQGLQRKGATLLHPVQGNEVFCALPRAIHRALNAGGAAYYLIPDASLDGPEDAMLGARLVCNWSTDEDEIEAFLALL